MFRTTRSAFLEHEKAKTELKDLMPEDAREAFGHGIRAKRSKEILRLIAELRPQPPPVLA